mmetsp:Transcript_60500/g.118605  ORF Transcript_60500/g.118605 Transcript_60500/m.118605 type:complete len:95 (-) Transcript_60500:311-595(-)
MCYIALPIRAPTQPCFLSSSSTRHFAVVCDDDDLVRERERERAMQLMDEHAIQLLYERAIQQPIDAHTSPWSSTTTMTTTICPRESEQYSSMIT